MKNKFRVALLTLALLFGSLFLLNNQTAVAAEGGVNNYAKLCSNEDGIVWNTDNPLPLLAPCVNPGVWGAADFSPSEGGYDAQVFEGYQALLQEAESYTSGLIWFMADFAPLCNNEDGIIWNSNNPLPPIKPCNILGQWVAVEFGPNAEPYETQRFSEYEELFAEAEGFQWGTIWFEPALTQELQNPLYLPLVVGPEGETLCRQGERSASCGLPVPEPR